MSDIEERRSGKERRRDYFLHFTGISYSISKDERRQYDRRGQVTVDQLSKFMQSFPWDSLPSPKVNSQHVAYLIISFIKSGGKI